MDVSIVWSFRDVLSAKCCFECEAALVTLKLLRPSEVLNTSTVRSNDHTTIVTSITRLSTNEQSTTV
jgi:hypothetical protein